MIFRDYFVTSRLDSNKLNKYTYNDNDSFSVSVNLCFITYETKNTFCLSFSKLTTFS